MNTPFEQHVTDSLARLETNMKALVGNGQPGRISIIERKVSALIVVAALLAAAILGQHAPAIISWLK